MRCRKKKPSTSLLSLIQSLVFWSYEPRAKTLQTDYFNNINDGRFQFIVRVYYISWITSIIPPYNIFNNEHLKEKLSNPCSPACQGSTRWSVRKRWELNRVQIQGQMVLPRPKGPFLLDWSFDGAVEVSFCFSLHESLQPAATLAASHHSLRQLYHRPRLHPG